MTCLVSFEILDKKKALEVIKMYLDFIYKSILLSAGSRFYNVLVSDREAINLKLKRL